MKDIKKYIIESTQDEDLEYEIGLALKDFGNVRNGFKWAKEDDIKDALYKAGFDYDEEYQPSLNIGGNVKAEGNWYNKWSNDSDGYDDDDRINWGSWLWKWRRTFFDGGRYKDDFSFYISEPRYGWSGFDDSTWEDACETAAKRCSEILNKEK